jgi:anti-sigma B factor antagonist
VTTVPEQGAFRVSSLDGPPIVSTPDEIDVTNSDELRLALLAASADDAPVVVADLSATSFCDSTALGVLVRAAKQLTSNGAQLRLVAQAAPVLRILTLTGVDTVLPVYATLPEALAAGPRSEAAD